MIHPEGDGTVGTLPPQKKSKDDGPYKSKKMKVGEKRLANVCDLSPQDCQCPPGSVKLRFFESEGGLSLSRFKLTCAPSQCPENQILRKRTDLASGVVNYKCEDVAK